MDRKLLDLADLSVEEFYETAFGIIDPLHIPSRRLQATGFINPKSTTLFFDKVWLPTDILDYYSQDYKSIYDLIETNGFLFFNSFYLSKDNGAEAFWGAANRNSGYKRINANNEEEVVYYTTHHRNMAIKEYAESVRRRFNIEIVPVYLDSKGYEKELNKEHHNLQSNVISLCIENFPQIAEEELDWEQIADFKRDYESVKALHRFHRWIRLEFKGKSKSEMEDLLLKSLDDYRFALKKHGIITTTGVVSSIVSAIPSLYSTIVEAQNPTPLAISLTAGITLFTVNKTIEYYERKREPIAFIYDVIK